MKRDEIVLNRVRGKKVLDVGFVDMYRTLYLHKRIASVSEVKGIDIDEGGVKKAKGLGLDVCLMDAERIDFKEKFDVVVACDVIEHLNNFGLFLEGAHKHLNSNGILFIATVNPDYWRLDEEKSKHTCRMSFATLKELLGRYGFIIEYQGYTKGEYYSRSISDFIPFNRFKDTIYVVAKRVKK